MSKILVCVYFSFFIIPSELSDCFSPCFYQITPMMSICLLLCVETVSWRLQRQVSAAPTHSTCLSQFCPHCTSFVHVCVCVCMCGDPQGNSFLRCLTVMMQSSEDASDWSPSYEPQGMRKWWWELFLNMSHSILLLFLPVLPLTILIVLVPTEPMWLRLYVRKAFSLVSK